MDFPPPGHCRSAAGLRARLQELGAGFDLDDELRVDGALAQPLGLYGRTLGNRFATQPMEGWDGTCDGGPTALTNRRWRRFGQSGAALVFGGEAFAVSPDGRANPHQLCLGPDSERHLVGLLAELRAGAAAAGRGEPVVGLQLTHSGRFARPHGVPAGRLAHHHPLLALKHGLPP
ncbi:MAG: NADH:flavin oxidoreductase, partial [Planctomycetes bacterium]|nr:NADH:flavin oxidoreductase [Planctomycetota bacterium]